MMEFAESIRNLASVDAEYRFGQPKAYVSPLELARLTILRSQLGETRLERAAERISVAGRRSSTDRQTNHVPAGQRSATRGMTRSAKTSSGRSRSASSVPTAPG